MSDATSIDQVLRAHSNSTSEHRVSKHSSTSPPSHTHNGSISGTSGSSGLNPRSCVTCRRRKVKCDKKHPCTNCTKARIECIFPAPGRAPRKPRKPADAELLDRLKKLEGVVKTLGGVPAISESEGPTQGAQKDESQPAQSQEPEPEKQNEETNVFRDMCSRDPAPGRYLPPENAAIAGLETRFGRLVVDEGKSRYINSSFWANLDNEVCDLVCFVFLFVQCLICGIDRWKISKPSYRTLPTTRKRISHLQTPPLQMTTKATSLVTGRPTWIWHQCILPQKSSK